MGGKRARNPNENGFIQRKTHRSTGSAAAEDGREEAQESDKRLKRIQIKAKKCKPGYRVSRNCKYEWSSHLLHRPLLGLVRSHEEQGRRQGALPSVAKAWRVE